MSDIYKSFTFLFFIISFNGFSQDWTQLGSDIDGELVGDESGSFVSFNGEGNIVAIGALHNDGGGDVSGHVRVYQYSGGIWIQIGDDIDGTGDGTSSNEEKDTIEGEFREV